MKRDKKYYSARKENYYLSFLNLIYGPKQFRVKFLKKLEKIKKIVLSVLLGRTCQKAKILDIFLVFSP
jgi:hypothetical protein